jgi:hypothetical protein
VYSCELHSLASHELLPEMLETIHLALIPDYKLKTSDPQVTSSFFRSLTRIKNLGGFFIGSKVKESGSKRVPYANTQKNAEHESLALKSCYIKRGSHHEAGTFSPHIYRCCNVFFSARFRRDDTG